MSTVADLAGNNPVALDPATKRTDKISSVEYRGPTQELAIGASPATSTPFGNRTQFVRIAPSGDITYDIGTSPDATDATKYSFLAANAVETVPVRPGESIQIDQVGASTGICTITEDAV